MYRTIASSAPVKDKANALAYFETLCGDTAAANVLINSSLTVLFVRMLRNGRTPLLRVRLASVLGLLVRHATYISDELAGTQLVPILAEALADKNERVRRRCGDPVPASASVAPSAQTSSTLPHAQCTYYP